jgi:hypothetical protein
VAAASAETPVISRVVARRTAAAPLPSFMPRVLMPRVLIH